ncbi:NEP1-interacting protein 1-like [Gastrolobium bilobum]|uniref:NEP1-interacting protein 1-like n=1 Tax=Gastrolobium bilobum TaxID=150636 RepID=UPI002AB244A5|nr:NEP1-interacting protein 1-like [Gastrolobium bilobum]
MPILYTSPTMTKWFSGMMGATIRCKEAFSLWVLAGNGGYAVGLFIKAIERVIFAEFTCILALGGSIMGIIAGAIKGQTTEGGFLDGAGKGAVTGAIAALELLNFATVDEPLSKVALLRSLLNGKLFMEWICPAVAQAYECHINTQERTYIEVSDTYDVRGVRVTAMPQNFIQKLPVQKFNYSKMLKLYHESCCSICFQDFEDGEFVRILPKCGHFFHLDCIDKWLVQQGSCPMCRTYVPHL